MHRKRSALSVFLFILFLVVACNKPNDDAIATQIKARMFSEPLLKSASVNVVSKDRIVTLTGEVPDQTARIAAQSIASKTAGVTQVIDSLSIAAPAPPLTAAEPAPAPATEPLPVLPKAKPKKKPAAEQPSETAPATPTDDQTASAANNLPDAPLANPQPAVAPAPPPTPPPPPPPQPITVTIPEGSIVTIRTIDAIDSSTSSTGQSFRASLDAPVVVNDRVVLPRGLNVNLKLVQADSAGKFSGRSELTVSLDRVTYQGKTYSLETSDVQQQGSSRGKRSVAVIGGSAVLGALIGGLAGGGKGAAIGAGVGAGGGTAVQAATQGQQVKIPSETRLDFTLHAAVPVTYLPPKTLSQPAVPNTDQATPAPPEQTQAPNMNQTPSSSGADQSQSQNP